MTLDQYRSTAKRVVDPFVSLSVRLGLTPNGVSVAASLDGVATLADNGDRRTGFVGRGMPADRQENLEGVPDDAPVPEESPLFMGFAAGFRRNQATEDRVAIREGPFAAGTTKHVSNLRQRLDDWYGEHGDRERVMEMFSPEHAEEGWVEGVGFNLGDDSRVDETLDDILAQAKEYGRVGHAQKAARANRDDDGGVRLLRRHFESTDDGVASLHFPSLQRRTAGVSPVMSVPFIARRTRSNDAIRRWSEGKCSDATPSSVDSKCRRSSRTPPSSSRLARAAFWA